MWPARKLSRSAVATIAILAMLGATSAEAGGFRSPALQLVGVSLSIVMSDEDAAQAPARGGSFGLRTRGERFFALGEIGRVGCIVVGQPTSYGIVAMLRLIPGDAICSIDGQFFESGFGLESYIANYSPVEFVQIGFIRGNQYLVADPVQMPYLHPSNVTLARPPAAPAQQYGSAAPPAAAPKAAPPKSSSDNSGIGEALIVGGLIIGGALLLNSLFSSSSPSSGSRSSSTRPSTSSPDTMSDNFTSGGGRTKQEPEKKPAKEPKRSYGLYGDCPQAGAGYGC